MIYRSTMQEKPPQKLRDFYYLQVPKSSEYRTNFDKATSGHIKSKAKEIVTRDGKTTYRY